MQAAQFGRPTRVGKATWQRRIGLPGRVPGRGVGAVGKWPAVATVQSLAEAGHLSTASDPRRVVTAGLRLRFELRT
jgi:hypothetical protein